MGNCCFLPIIKLHKDASQNIFLPVVGQRAPSGVQLIKLSTGGSVWFRLVGFFNYVSCLCIFSFEKKLQTMKYSFILAVEEEAVE